MPNDVHVHPPAPRPVWPTQDPSDTGRLVRPTVLSVALSDHALMQMPRHVLAPGALVGQSSFAQVHSGDVVGAHAPDLILCPLLSFGFDAMDLLTLLREAGYAGRFLVLAPPMPNIALIRSEMWASAPNLNVDIIALDGSPVLHLI